MIATTEEQRLLEKWQKKLCLQEWRIKLVTHLRPEEMSVSNATGCTDGERCSNGTYAREQGGYQRQLVVR